MPRTTSPLVALMTQRSTRRLAVAVGAAVVVAAGAVMPVASSAASWSVSLPGADLTALDRGGGVFVDDGRVWWLAGGEVRSRSIGGGETRRTRLQYPPAPDAAFPRFGALRFVVADGGVLLVGRWFGVQPELGSGDTTTSAPETVVMVFDPRSGALERMQTYAPGVVKFAFGSRPVILRRDPSGTPLPAFNAVTDRPLATLSADHLAFAAGSSFLSFPGGRDSYDNDWTKGRGTAEVRDAASGVRRYGVSAPRIRQRAGAPSSAATEVQLQANGTLSALLYRRAGMHVRPTYVDQRGRTRSVGTRIRNATLLRATVAHGRALVWLERIGTADRECQALWLGSSTGARWRRISLPKAGEVDVAAWTSRYLVLRIGPVRRGPDVLKVIDRPHRVALSKTRRPTCEPQ